MINKNYKSFHEIDQDLKILKLKREITVWSMKNDYQRLQSSLSPKNLALGLWDNFSTTDYSVKWSKILRNFAIGYFIKRILKR